MKCSYVRLYFHLFILLKIDFSLIQYTPTTVCHPSSPPSSPTFPLHQIHLLPSVFSSEKSKSLRGDMTARQDKKRYNKITLATQALRSTINKWELTKLKGSVKWRAPSCREISNCKWEKIFSNFTSNWRIISKIYKELKKTWY